MDDFGIGNNIRKKRTQTCRRPKLGSHDQVSVSSTPPSDDASKISSDENGVDANPRRKVFNLNQGIATQGKYSITRVQNEDGGYNNVEAGDVNEEAQIGLNHSHSHSQLRKVKLKVGGATRTIQPKIGFASVSDSTHPARPKLIMRENSDEDRSRSPPDKKIGLQGVPWKDFSRAGFKLGRDSKQGEVRKSKRVPKKRVLDVDFDDDDDEIRYLEKLKTVKVSAAYKDFDEDSNKKHRSLSKSDSVSLDTDYEEEDRVSDQESEGKKRTLTSRQRALLGRDSGASQTEFPNGLPPAPSRKQKEKLTEVEQQLKKAEAAERRRMQNEKAARESEAEAIRKILGQDSSRKKREDKLKKRREELAQERAENAKILAPNTVRTVFGPNGTIVSFAEDIGLPRIFDPRPCCYPGPRAKCVGPSCSNPYKYRDSKSNLPVCSLHCYKAVRERTIQC